MSIVKVEHPVINESSFEPQNRQHGISGCMNIHNESEFLAQTIETWIDAVDELAIVFNECTDNSPEIIEAYERKYYPKIRAFHYVPHVYSPNTKEQLELETNNIQSFTFYSNFTVSQTRYKICVPICGDHVGIPDRLNSIYHYLKTTSAQNTAWFFSGVNLWRHPDDIRYHISLRKVAIGNGDLAYWTVSPQHIFVKNPNYPEFTLAQYNGLEDYYLGYIFWHTRYLKKDQGLGNYGVYSESLNQFLQVKIKEAQLIPLSPQFKQQNKELQNIPLRRCSLYFDFGSLPDVVGVDSTIEILQQAVQHQQANRLTQAEQAYRQVLDSQPDRPEALYGLGILAQQMGNQRMAEELLSRASQIQPDSVKIWFSLGNLRQSQGQFTEAVDAYNQALKLRPNAATIYNNLGYTLQQQQRWEEAIASYQKALELQPKCVEADVNLGNALYAQGQLTPEQQTHYAKLNHQLGESRQKAGDLQTAVAYYRQAIAMQPNLLDTLYNLGVVLQDQGELEEARACYQKVLELNPDCKQAVAKLDRQELENYNAR